MLTKFHAVIRALLNTKKVTIAAVHGHCLGGGAELAMVCDVVYTSTTARWGFPEIKLGCYPPVACTALAALVGQKRASELILTGRTISGARPRKSVWPITASRMNSCRASSREQCSKCSAESKLAVDYEESYLCMGRGALRQRPGARRKDLSGRVDEDCGRAGRHSCLYREA